MTLGRSTAFTEPFGRNEEGFVLLAFIDESALMHKNDDSPFYVLAAVCFHEWEIAKVDKKIFHAKQKFAALKYKSHERKDMAIAMEIKAKKLITPRSIGLSYNREFLDELFQVVVNSKAKILRIVGERPDFDVTFEKGKLKPHYTQLIRLLEKAAGEHNVKNISVVFDNINDGDALETSKQFSNLIHKAGHGPNLPYEHITAWPLFVNSEVVAGIQIADIVAGLIRHRYCMEFDSAKKKDYPHDFSEWVYKKYAVLQSKFWLDAQKWVLLKKEQLSKELLAYQ